MVSRRTFSLSILSAAILLTTVCSTPTQVGRHTNGNGEMAVKEFGARTTMRNAVSNNKKGRVEALPITEDDVESMTISDVQFSTEDMLRRKSSRLVRLSSLEGTSGRQDDDDGDVVWIPVEIETTEKLTRKLWNRAIRQAMRQWRKAEGLKKKQIPLLNLDLTRKTLLSDATITRRNGVRIISFNIRLKIIRRLVKVSDKKTLRENSQNVRNLTDVFLKNDFYIGAEGNLSAEIKTEFSVLSYRDAIAEVRSSRRNNRRRNSNAARNLGFSMSRYISTCSTQRCATKVDVWSTVNIKSSIVNKAITKVKQQAGFKVVYNMQKTKYRKIKWNIYKVVFPFELVYQNNQDF